MEEEDGGDGDDLSEVVEVLNISAYSGVEDMNLVVACVEFPLCMKSYQQMNCKDIDVEVSWLNQTAEDDTCTERDLPYWFFYLFSFCLLPYFAFELETQQLSLNRLHYCSCFHVCSYRLLAANALL